MNAFVFIFGMVVTLVAVGAVGSIWWAALRDGQTNDAIRRGEQTGLDASPPLRPVPPPVDGVPIPPERMRAPRTKA